MANTLRESILEYSGIVLNEGSKMAEQKEKIRKAVLRIVASKSPMEESLKKLSKRMGIVISSEELDDDNIKGYFYVDLKALKKGDEESFVSFKINEMAD
jgi:hypothetical protein